MPSVVTANALRSGEAVYLAADRRWVRDLGQAAVADDDGALDALARVAADAVAARDVTGVYAMDVRLAAGRPAPASVRETIRAAGAPTI